MSDNSIILEIGGVNYTGWTTLSIVRAMETLTGSFAVDLATVKDSRLLDVVKGDPCTVHIQTTEGQEVKLITGYIDSVSKAITDRGVSLSISGRDKTLDLVDCSAIFKPSNTWRQKDLYDILVDICNPFNIKVSDESIPGDPFKKVTIQSGETAFTLIERLCKQRGVLPLTNFEGDLLLTYSQGMNTEPVFDLISGYNIKGLTEVDSLKEQFSEYTVKGQNSGGGLSWQDSVTTSFKGTAEDLSVPRYRPLVLMAESKATPNSVKERAAWEAQVRAGKSKVYTCQVQGWFYNEGDSQNAPAPWAPNTIVNLISEDLSLYDKKVVTNVSLRLNNQGGHVTDLVLKHPDTFKKNPNPVIDL